MSASWREIVLARRSSPILGTRRLHWTGAILAAIALLLRLATPVLPPVLAADAGNSNAAFDEHYLCRAAAEDAATPGDAPAPDAPAHHDHDDLGCCLWHAATGAALLPTAVGQPVVFAAGVAATFPPETHDVPAIPRGTARARAPPARA